MGGIKELGASVAEKEFRLLGVETAIRHGEVSGELIEYVDALKDSIADLSLQVDTFRSSNPFEGRDIGIIKGTLSTFQKRIQKCSESIIQCKKTPEQQSKVKELKTLQESVQSCAQDVFSVSTELFRVGGEKNKLILQAEILLKNPRTAETKKTLTELLDKVELLTKKEATLQGRLSFTKGQLSNAEYAFKARFREEADEVVKVSFKEYYQKLS